MFDRGFTGHEHLNAFGLINMNGRMYDPVMSSFLSVDNYVQCPDFSQNFNRYAYCLDNPLKYTDPSGELFGIDDIIGRDYQHAAIYKWQSEQATIWGMNEASKWLKYAEIFRETGYYRKRFYNRIGEMGFELWKLEGIRPW